MRHSEDSDAQKSDRSTRERPPPSTLRNMQRSNSAKSNSVVCSQAAISISSPLCQMEKDIGMTLSVLARRESRTTASFLHRGNIKSIFTLKYGHLKRTNVRTPLAKFTNWRNKID